jgi:hypothetical protein
VGSFVRRDKLQVDEKFFGEAGVQEVLQLEADKGFLVEGAFELFKLWTIQVSTISSEKSRCHGREMHSQSKRIEES